YFNFDYEISIAQFGLAWYWNSWSPSALDMFMNGEFTIAPWFRLKPIKGMTIEGELATNASTIYMDGVDSNDNNIDWVKYRKKKEAWDVFANSAALLRVGYVYSKKLSFNIDGSVKAAGTEFKGMLGGEGGQFSGWYDSNRRVNGVTNYSVGANPYYDNDKGAAILSTLDFGINPIPNQKKLLRIGLKDEFVVGKLDSPLMKDDGVYDKTNNKDGYQELRHQFDWLCTPSIGTELLKGKIALDLSATFSVTNYGDNVVADQLEALDKLGGVFAQNATGLTKAQMTTTFATFNNLNFSATFDQISKVLKTVKVDYKMEMAWYDAYYPTDSADVDQSLFTALQNQGAQLKTMYNQVVAEMSFAKDITLGLGFIVRNYFGDQETALYNQVNPSILSRMSDNQIAALTGFGGATNSSDAIKAWWKRRVDYWNVGWAIQFKYKIPVDWLQFPILFVNLGLGWDPFDDDGSTTQNWYKDKDSAHANSWSKNNTDWTSERSVFTIGIVWDF
ncbi:MAG: hypothetical protein IKP67_01820, partial [Spirochaetales bacterium]|nr:hypothetical protein [Spirochaetales bacterium]